MRLALLALSRDGCLESSLPTFSSPQKCYFFLTPYVISEMFGVGFIYLFVQSEPLQRHSRLLMPSLKDPLVNVLAQL